MLHHRQSPAPIRPQPQIAPASSQRLWLRVIAALVVACVTFGWLDDIAEHRDLAKPDEGRYAEIPREMVATGDWVMPRLNGFVYLEKPPLQYWATAAAYRVFGVEYWVARLWPLATGFAGLIVLLLAAWRLFGGSVALASFCILTSALLYLLFAFVVTLDMGLTFFLSGTLLGFLLAQHRGSTLAERDNWMLIVWTSMALAVLSKGPIGILLPGLVLGAYVLATRDWGLLSRLNAAWGAALFALITAPWFIAVQMRTPEFFDFFFLHEHFERFLVSGHHRPGSAWYFLVVLLIGFLPWTPLLLVALREVSGRWRELVAPCSEGVDAYRLLWLWMAIILAFFTLSESKLPAYILPIFPALALLVAPIALRIGSRVLAAAIATNVIVVLGIAVSLPYLREIALTRQPAELVDGYLPWVHQALWWLGGGATLAAILAWRGVRIPALGTLAVCSLFAWDAAIDGVDVLAPTLSAAPLIHQLESITGPIAEVPFFSVGTYDQTLPFYLNRTVTLVDYRDEFELGISLEPEKQIPRIAEFRERWEKTPRAYAILTLPLFREMTAAGWQARELQRDSERVIVAKP